MEMEFDWDLAERDLLEGCVERCVVLMLRKTTQPTCSEVQVSKTTYRETLTFIKN